MVFHLDFLPTYNMKTTKILSKISFVMATFIFKGIPQFIITGHLNCFQLFVIKRKL